MTPDEEQKSGRDAYWRAREASDAEREGVSAEPADAADAGPPPTPGLEPVPDSDPEGWSPYAKPMQTSAATAAAGPDMKAQRLAALREAARLANSPLDTGIGDKEISAAQGRDRSQRGRDAFTEAIQAWMQRRPIRFSQPTEGEDLVKRRQLAEGSALKQRGQQLSVQEQIAKALTEPKPTASPGGLSEYQKYEMDRNARLDAEKKSAGEKKSADAAAQLERDRATLQKDFLGYDLSQADEKTIEKLLSLRHAKAAEAQAAATLSENKEQHISQQTHELTKELGDPTTFDSQYARIQQLIAENGGAVPGAGKLEALKQDSVLAPLLSSTSSNEAVEGRKLIKQLGNNYVHAITGAGVSNAERAQLQSASVDINSSDDRQIVLGLKTLKDMYDAKVHAAKAGVRPEAAARIDAATPKVPPPVSSHPPPGVIPPGAKNVRRLKSGAWAYTLPDGTEEAWEP